ncbi:MAG: DUF2093 domain-containing protein [Alphaproteobacteria bacterium]|nr:DUF2093 domain-containing protein [Alphaproteobacteria bacterium]
MNFHEHPIPPQREAKLRYLDSDFQVLKEGEFVRCAVTGDPIRIDNLKYWSVDRQEAYKSAAESLIAEKRNRR